MELNSLPVNDVFPDTGVSGLHSNPGNSYGLSVEDHQNHPQPYTHIHKFHPTRGESKTSADLQDSTVWNSSQLADFLISNMTDNVNTTESPEAESEEAFKGAQIAYIIIYMLLVVVAVIGNSCAVYVVVSRRKMRNVTNYFIASLAVSDILMALVCVPFSFVANVLFNYWPFGAALCPVVGYVQAAVVFQNAYTLLAMSLERYIAIMHPFLRRLGKKRCLQVVTLCWLLAFLTPIPTAVTSDIEHYPFDENGTDGYHLCVEQWRSENQRFSYSLAIMVLQYFVPLAVLIFTYSKIVLVVWLKDIPPTPGQVISTQDQLMNSENGPKVDEQPVADPRKKVIKMMLTVVSIYAICWLPLHALTIAYDVDNTIYQPAHMRYVWVAAHWLAMSSCAYNPFIYWWMNPKFREGYILIFAKFRTIMCCLCEKGTFRKESVSSSSSRRFVSRLGNGSTFTQVSRRPSGTITQMDMTTIDLTPRKNGCNNKNNEQNFKATEKNEDCDLSKISEATENDTSPSVEKSKKIHYGIEEETPFC